MTTPGTLATGPSPAPLKIKCTSRDCGNDLHCYRKQRAKAGTGRHGPCVECGANLVDWPRVHARRIADKAYTVDRLRTEYVRHTYWHIELPARALNYAYRRGKSELRARATKRLTQAIGGARHPLEGRQTPWASDNPITYAQHATATCCRRCLEEWHAIPMNTQLAAEQIDYLTDLVMSYIEVRIPELPTSPRRVAPIRKSGP